jgi:hypothetical protein
MKSQSNFIRFIELAKKELRSIPKYSSKFSNKIYNNHQKIILLLIRQRWRLTYREVIELLYVSSEVCITLELKRIPEHSTLVKFAKRISVSMLDSLLSIKQAGIAAIDSTGFETESKSYYYRQAYRSKEKQKTRRYDKLSIAVDTDKQLILSQRIRKGPRNDNIDFKTLLRDLKIDYVVADKGYDSRANRLYALRKLKAYPHIPYRKNSGATYIKKKRKLKFDESIYHQRSKVRACLV